MSKRNPAVHLRVISSGEPPVSEDRKGAILQGPPLARTFMNPVLRATEYI